MDWLAQCQAYMLLGHKTTITKRLVWVSGSWCGVRSMDGNRLTVESASFSLVMHEVEAELY